MIIDIFLAILIVLAIIKGYSKGAIIALFSLIGFVIGIAAALKLSATVSERLGTALQTSSKWLPFISFIVVFVVVILLVKLGAKMLQKTVELVMLGWLNRLGGIIFYGLLYTFILSVILFYLVQLKLVSPATTAASIVYPYLSPLAPKVINALGEILPIFKNLFEQLSAFFGKAA